MLHPNYFIQFDNRFELNTNIMLSNLSDMYMLFVYFRLMLGIMIPTWFISMWICNTSTTALMLPIAYAILLQLKDTDKDLNKNISK